LIVLCLASSLGAAITSPICGFMIADLGWASAFYMTGIVGFLWTLLWFVLIYDSPAQHPRISKEERDFIEAAIGTDTARSNEKVMKQLIAERYSELSGKFHQYRR